MVHYPSLSEAGDWERGQGTETTQGKFQGGMRALGTTMKIAQRSLGD